MPAGRARIVASEPPIETCRGALYVPAAGEWSEAGWGLYDAGDRLVVSAARWVAGDDAAPSPASGHWTAPRSALDRVAPGEPGGVFVYGGLLEPGRAEFLSGALSRFWSHATRASRVLFHAREPLADLFDVPLIAATMAALGITAADCVVLDTPTRLDCVVVPAASFETGRLAYPAYARLAATLTIRLAGRTVPADLGRAPLHVSSAREPVTAFAGEDDFDSALREQGVAIVHPSEMSFAAFVARVRSAGLLSSTSPAGAAGAGCLGAAFRQSGCRLVLCAGEVAPDSLNVDALCGHEGVYLRADGENLAASYLRAMRRLIVTRHLPCDMTPDGAMTDLGLGPVVCTSLGDGEAAVLVGGPLTGLAQLRIEGGSPWWQVDLGSAVEVSEVRVHGPVIGEDRPSILRLFGSFNERSWDILGVHDSMVPIGGIDGSPHRFESGERPWRVRFLRLQSGTGVLALDQIEILAPAGTSGSAAFEAIA